MTIELLMVVLVIAFSLVMALFWRWFVSRAWPWYRFVSVFVVLLPPAVFFLSCRELLNALPQELVGLRRAIIGTTIVMTVASIVLAWCGLRKHPETGGPRAKQWSAGLLAIAALIAAGIALMIAQHLDNWARWRLIAMGEEARALAVSVAPVPVPDADNAQEGLVQANYLLGGVARDTRLQTVDAYWSLIEAADDNELTDPTLIRAVEELRDVVLVIRAAAARRAYYVPRSFEYPQWTMLIPEVQRNRDFCRLLALDAKTRIARGDWDEAIANLHAIFQLADHNLAEPFHMAAYVSFAMEELGRQALRYLLSRGDLPIDKLQRLELPIAEKYAQAFQRAEIFGRAGWYDLIRQMAYADSWPAWIDRIQWDMEKQRALPLPIYRLWVAEHDAKAYYVNRANTVFYHSMNYRQARDYHTRLAPQTVYRYPLQSWIALENAQPVPPFLITTRAIALRRMSRVAVALHQYRHTTGSWPTRLDDLTDRGLLFSDIVDPFSGDPLMYRVRDGNFILYSVGPNLTDEQAFSDGADPNQGDLVWERRQP